MLTIKDFINRFALDRSHPVRVWSANTAQVIFEGTYNELERSEYVDKTIDSINAELYSINTPCLCFNID